MEAKEKYTLENYQRKAENAKTVRETLDVKSSVSPGEPTYSDAEVQNWFERRFQLQTTFEKFV